MSEQKQPWYHMGRRFTVAAFAAFILFCSLISVKSSYDDNRNTTSIEIRHDPNLLLGAIGLYLLGVATNFDLALPLKSLTGRGEVKSRQSSVFSSQNPTED